MNRSDKPDVSVVYYSFIAGISVHRSVKKIPVNEFDSSIRAAMARNSKVSLKNFDSGTVIHIESGKSRSAHFVILATRIAIFDFIICTNRSSASDYIALHQAKF